jgi:hypothetical protein
MGVRVRAWQVHDTGLVAAPGRFRRLPGRVRHHQGAGERWPDQLELALGDEELVVSDRTGAELGRWPRREVTVRLVAQGPPVSFVIEVPGAAHLVAAAADPTTAGLLAALGADLPG